MADALTIEPTPPQRQAAALELLFSALAPSERVAQLATTMAALRDGRLSLSGLLQANRGDETVGCVWASAMGGRAALVWPPQLAAGEDQATIAELHQAVEQWMRESDLRLANAFLSDDHSSDARHLLAAGYSRAAEILYLVSERAAFPVEPITTALEFETFSEEKQDRLGAIVEQTYEGTLDCPSLNGERNIADILQGYRQTGAYDPARWLLVRHENTDIGCLILADHATENQWELVYQGVVPSHRGRGFGVDMTRHAQWLTGDAGRSRLVLAVDAGNRPAIAAYATAGFQQWDRRYVYVKILGGDFECGLDQR